MMDIAMTLELNLYEIMPEYSINFPSPGGLARLWREGMKGRGK